MSRIEIDSLSLAVSHRDKVLFPGDGLTKGDLIDYYRRVAATMLPHLSGRPVTMHRFPEGIGRPGFFQQSAPEHFPGWIRRASLPKKGGGRISHLVCDRAATLVFLADQACITPHVWLSRADEPEYPDRMIFDLDPADQDFGAVRAAARSLRGLLQELGLTCLVMTTGSRGLHLVVPLDRRADFEAVRSLARRVARELARREPGRVTVEPRKAKRRGRLYLDVLRNAYGQTAVAPYAVRARPGAPVAAPLDWSELGRSGMGPRRYTIKNVFRRLGLRPDPWEGIERLAGPLEEASRRLSALAGR